MRDSISKVTCISVVLPAILGLALAVAGEARADLITQVRAENGPQALPDGDVWYQGTTSSSHVWSSGPNFVGSSGSDGSAIVSLLGGDAGIHLVASSHLGSVFNVAGEWVDVIRLAGPPADAPASIRIGVHVDGNLRADLGANGGNAQARFDLANLGFGEAFTNSINGSTLPPNLSEAFLIVTPTETSFAFGTSQNVINSIYNPITGSVSWDTSYVLSYDQSLGGYQMNLYAIAGANTFADGTATADFGNTIRLTSVGQDDGSPLPGPVTFDSGFTLSTVPEPSSLTLVVIGTAGLLGFGWRRRRAVVVRPGGESTTSSPRGA